MATAAGALTALVIWGITGWSVAYAFELASDGLSLKTLFAKLEYLSILFVPSLWLALVLEYTGRERWITRRNAAIAAIVPLLVLGLVWTNEAHDLVWREIVLVPSGPFMVWDVTYGAGFWLNAVYSYALALFGVVLLVRALPGATKMLRGQVTVLLAGGLVPLIGNVL